MKTIVYVGTSLDGFIARENGDIDWLIKFENEEINLAFEKFMSGIDAVVMGRNTFEKVLTYPSWPYQKKVFVLSSIMKQIPESFRGKVTLLSLHPRELINYFDNQGFSNIYIDGGKTIQNFLKEDCIDELIITKAPVLIGQGISLFGSLENHLSFRHIQTEVYSHGLVRSHYERIRK